MSSDPACGSVKAMRPIDLPPDDLRAELCRPAEVRESESYLSNPPDDEDHERVHVVGQQHPPQVEPPPGRFVTDGVQRPASWQSWYGRYAQDASRVFPPIRD